MELREAVKLGVPVCVCERVAGIVAVELVVTVPVRELVLVLDVV